MDGCCEEWTWVSFYLNSSHWYLAVICFPGKDGQTLVNEINDEDDGSDSKVLVSFNNLSDGRQVVRNWNVSFQLITKFMLKKQTKKQTKKNKQF